MSGAGVAATPGERAASRRLTRALSPPFFPPRAQPVEGVGPGRAHQVRADRQAEGRGGVGAVVGPAADFVVPFCCWRELPRDLSAEKPAAHGRSPAPSPQPRRSPRRPQRPRPQPGGGKHRAPVAPRIHRPPVQWRGSTCTRWAGHAVAVATPAPVKRWGWSDAEERASVLGWPEKFHTQVVDARLETDDVNYAEPARGRVARLGTRRGTAAAVVVRRGAHPW